MAETKRKRRSLKPVGCDFHMRKKDANRAWRVALGDIFFLECCDCGLVHVVSIEKCGRNEVCMWMHRLDRFSRRRREGERTKSQNRRK